MDCPQCGVPMLPIEDAPTLMGTFEPYAEQPTGVVTTWRCFWASHCDVAEPRRQPSAWVRRFWKR